jgi:tRNA threonylcarbamoyladenosine biosynthesis protein TsaB
VFTSLRVGLAFVKGLALARRLPLVGIPTLDVTAAAVSPEKTPLVAVLQAGRGRIAAAWYKATREGNSSAGGWQVKEPARVTTVEALSESLRSRAVVCGELSAAERPAGEKRFVRSGQPGGLCAAPRPAGRACLGALAAR